MPARDWGRAVLTLLVLGQIYALYVYVPAPGPGVPHVDKVAHVLIFGVPAALAAALRARKMLGLLVLHAIVSEPLQAWLPVARNPDAFDSVADLLGILVGMLIGWGVVARWGNGDAREDARTGRGER